MNNISVTRISLVTEQCQVTGHCHLQGSKMTWRCCLSWYTALGAEQNLRLSVREFHQNKAIVEFSLYFYNPSCGTFCMEVHFMDLMHFGRARFSQRWQHWASGMSSTDKTLFLPQRVVGMLHLAWVNGFRSSWYTKIMICCSQLCHSFALLPISSACLSSWFQEGPLPRLRKEKFFSLWEYAKGSFSGFSHLQESPAEADNHNQRHQTFLESTSWSAFKVCAFQND